MLSLTINTSSSLGSMVIGSGEKILHKSIWHKEKSHSEKITVALEELLRQSGLKMKDLNLIICGYGPGSFTGLRVGLSVAKTLAYSLDIPIIAVDDCFSTALNAPQGLQIPIAVTIDAQKNKVFAGIYEQQGGKLVSHLQPCMLSFEDLEKALNHSSYACLGDAFSSYETFLPSTLRQKLKRLPDTSDNPSAVQIFEYVSKNISDFQKINWSALSALYLRASAAEEVLANKLSKNI